MATSGPAVSCQETPGGDYVIGATIEGVFVPFVHKHAGHVANVIAKANANAPTKAKPKAGEE